MRYIGFRIFSVLFGTVSLLVAGFFLASILMYNDTPEIALEALKHIGYTGTQAEIDALFRISMPIALAYFFLIGALDIFSFVLVVRNDRKYRIKKLHFVPGFIGSILSLTSVIGIVYFIIALRTLIAAQND